ncbi:MAG: hypothetical protein AAF502_04745 [Bacteroidota bacterium]
MKYQSTLFPFVLILLLTIAACNPFANDGIDLTRWNPGVAAPLFYATVTVEELLESYEDDGAVIEDDGEGRLTLVYTEEGYSVDLAELFEVIPDIEFPLPDNVFVFPYELPNNISIDYIDIKSGKIKYEIISPFLEPIDVTLRIEQIDLEGAIFEETFTVNFLQNNGEFDVADYRLTPDNDTLYIEYDAYKVSDGTEVDLDGLIGIEFSQLKHSYAQGYLGTGTYETDRDTIDVDFFEYFNSGTVFLEEPSIQVTIRNSFGFPVRLTFSILDAITKDGDRIPLSNAQLADGIDFNYPLLSEVGEFKDTYFEINQENSNLENMIGQPISGIDYEIVPIANPDSDTSVIGFLTDTSFFSVDVLVELPLYGRAQDFVFSDTFDIDLSDLDRVTDAEFKLVADNGFPMDVDMQIYFYDNAGQEIDVLFKDADRQVMAAATVDEDGKVNGVTTTETIEKVEGTRFTNIRDRAVKAVLTNTFSTVDGGNTSVRIFSDYTVNARLGVIAGVDPD